MRPHFITLLIVISLCGACSKKDKVTPINAALLNDFAFKQGSYWIYRDSLTGIYDSFVVTSAHMDEVTDQSGAHFYTYNHVISGADTNKVAMNFSVQKSGISFTYAEDFGESLINSLPYPFAESAFVHVHSSYSVAGNSYDTVAELTDVNSNDHFFLRRGVGFVKLRIDHNLHDHTFQLIDVKRVWELQRYHVIPNY